MCARRDLLSGAKHLFVAIALTTASASFSSSCFAQAAKMTNLTVSIKPGKIDGRAMATVNGKTGSISAHALQAWIIMDGQGALLLLSPAKRGQDYRVRYYELDADKGRLLGHVPFAKANLIESKAANGLWAFAISGTDPGLNKPLIFAGDTDAIRARITGSEPVFSADLLSFHTPRGAKTLTVRELLGVDFQRKIYAPSGSHPKVSYLEFLPSGESLTVDPAGEVDRGRWIFADGVELLVTSPKGETAVWPVSDLHEVMGIPATDRLTVRLLQPLSSVTATRGMKIKAISITPVVVQDSILIPQASEFDGEIVDAHGVGWGIRHETAAITVRFDSVRLPDGRTMHVDARLFKVENSREDVTRQGKIQGIRSTGTLGNSAENKISSLAQIDPVAYIFLGASGPAVLGFAESEILYNAGTELTVEFYTPVITTQKYPSHVTPAHLDGDQLDQFNAMVKALPYRTKTEGSNKVSDITNLIFVGTPSSVRRAFDAAGWVPADQLTSASTFSTVKTLTGNQTYNQAPMSTLLLGDEKPLFTLQKTTNTFSSRHHLRVFPTSETFDQKTVLTASSTQDVAIAFSYKQKTFIHVIDQYLDNERAKVINDLDFTGCVDHLELVPRPWVPQDAYNSTGDRLRTDGDAAVLFLNDCADPHTTPTTVAQRPPLFERSERNTSLTIKDQIYRGNLVYQGITGGIKIHSFLANRGELAEDTGNWRKSDASGTQYRLAGTAPSLLRRQRPWNVPPPAKGQDELDAASRARIASHRWDPPHYEIALNLGYSYFRNNILEIDVLDLISSDPSKQRYFLGLGDASFDGWAAGVSLTLNSSNWVSNEFSYMRQQTKYDLFAITVSSDPQQEPFIETSTVGLVTRRAAYNIVLNARPRRSRWRPYVDAGPVFQLLSLDGAPLKQPSGYFRLGLSNVGLIQAAFDFGNVPPLDGGGTFQLGLQYGAGMKFRVLPHFMIRGDYGETWSPNPRIIQKSYMEYQPASLDETYKTTVTVAQPASQYFQLRGTVGFAFTF